MGYFLVQNPDLSVFGNFAIAEIDGKKYIATKNGLIVSSSFTDFYLVRGGGKAILVGVDLECHWMLRYYAGRFHRCPARFDSVRYDKKSDSFIAHVGKRAYHLTPEGDVPPFINWWQVES